MLDDKLLQITGNLRILDVVSSQSRKYIYIYIVSQTNIYISEI